MKLDEEWMEGNLGVEKHKKMDLETEAEQWLVAGFCATIRLRGVN